MTTGVWTVDALAPLAVERDGLASRAPQTVAGVFRKTVARRGTASALRFRDASGDWQVLTWRQYFDNCALFAKALLRLGVRAHEAVAIMGSNCPQWFFANNGTILAGAIAAGVYTTSSADACADMAAHCEAKVVVVETREHLDRFLTNVEHLPALQALVIWENTPDMPLPECHVPIFDFAEFMRFGEKVSDVELEQRMDAQQPGHCCSLIYTSGTTGKPKAVMLSHDNWTWTSFVVLEAVEGVTEHERSVSFLPLAHVAAQLLDIHLPMFIGCEVNFAPRNVLSDADGPDEEAAIRSSTSGSGSDSGRSRSGSNAATNHPLIETLRQVRPTFFFAVPRVWEKIMDAMRVALDGDSGGGLKRALAKWARVCGADQTRRAQFGGDGKKSLGFRVANHIVLRKVKRALGLDECRYCFSAAAPMTVECLAFFGALDIAIYELFGQSECSGPHSINLPGKWKIGSIGNPLPATHTRIRPHHKPAIVPLNAIDSGADGEIEYAGRHIFMGYLHDEEATRTALVDGWLRSGDVGHFDEDGFLAITGRLQELIITKSRSSSGATTVISPVTIEEAIKRELPALSNVMVLSSSSVPALAGKPRKGKAKQVKRMAREYLVCLCTLRVKHDSDGVPSELLDRDAVAAISDYARLRRSSSVSSTTSSTRNSSISTAAPIALTAQDAQHSARVRRYIADGVARANARALTPAHRVHKFLLVARDFSVPGGELTPTLKLRRKVVTDMYEREIQALLASSDGKNGGVVIGEESDSDEYDEVDDYFDGDFRSSVRLAP
jgi:long-chain-fatty-acid--CoA ligase ACSBG